MHGSGSDADVCARSARDALSAALPAALAFAVTLAVFLPDISHDFIWLDDPIHVFQNPYLTPPNAAHLLHLWAHPYKGLYIPLSYTVWAALVALSHAVPPPNAGAWAGNLNPAAFHGANVVLHATNASLACLLLQRLTGSRWGSVAGALVFSLHPVQAESVAWVSELRGLLAAFFVLASALVALANANSAPIAASRWGVSFLLFICGLLCKPSAAVAPLLILLWEARINRRAGGATAIRCAPWLIAAAADLLATRSVQPPVDSIAVPLGQRLLVAGDALVFYLEKMIAPAGLCIDYGRSPQVVLAATGARIEWLLAVGVTLAALAARRRFPLLPVAAGTSFIALLPVLGLTPFTYQFYSTVADRYLYLAMLGPAILAACCVDRAARASQPALRRAGAIAAIAVIAALAGLTAAQNETWADTGSVMRQALRVNPESATAYVQLGQSAAVAGRTLEALALFEKAERARPETYFAHFDAGMELMNLADMNAAVAELDRAVRLAPGYAPARMSLGRALLATGQYAPALAQFRAAERLAPETPDLHEQLGDALLTLGRLPEALAQFQAQIAADPAQPAAYVNEGVILVRLGRPAAAIEAFDAALAIGPARAAWYVDLAAAQTMGGDTAGARASVLRALALSPASPQALALKRALHMR